jgi:hypothetical protein
MWSLMSCLSACTLCLACCDPVPTLTNRLKQNSGFSLLQGASAFIDYLQCQPKPWHRCQRACDIVAAGPLANMAKVSFELGTSVQLSFQENASAELLYAGDIASPRACPCTSFGCTDNAWHLPCTLALSQVYRCCHQ